MGFSVKNAVVFAVPKLVYWAIKSQKTGACARLARRSYQPGSMNNETPLYQRSMSNLPIAEKTNKKFPTSKPLAH